MVNPRQGVVVPMGLSGEKYPPSAALFAGCSILVLFRTIMVCGLGGSR